MCTLSIISLAGGGGGGGGFRVVMNRDEERTRPPALPPRWHELPGGKRAIWPVDPSGGGTWIAAAQGGGGAGGLVCCLLNGNPREPPPLPAPARALSRGLIIPTVIGEADAPAAISAAASMELDRFPPFRLVAVDAGPRVVDLRWDGRACVRSETSSAACFVSSGLGDHLAADRLPLFAEMVGRSPGAAAQDAFHRHSWPGRERVSVMMRRDDARTVSVATVTVVSGRVEMDYEAVAPGLG
ncbi:MAG: NRDE family protein [Phycisphaerales bacterium]